MKSLSTYRFFVTTAKGMEELLLQELAALDIPLLEKANSGVAFTGTLEAAYKVCLWSRVATRVLLQLATFDAPDPDKLYDGVKSIDWSEHLSDTDTLAVDFATFDSKITHSHYGALKVKDAIVDQFREKNGERPSIQIERPDVQINLYLYRDKAIVSIDLSGESLHRRGYRQELTAAPMKENLAAALLLTAGWPGDGTIAFLDPMSGSGTLPLEAALIAGNIAPGLGRDYFGFLGWKGHQSDLWNGLKEDAHTKIRHQTPEDAKIIGYDMDFRAIRTAHANCQRVPLLRGRVHFEKKDLEQIEAPAPKGILIVNPPYGERLGEVEKLKPLYRDLGNLFKQKFKGWDAYVFTGSPDLAKCIGLRTAKRHIFFNGPIECRLLHYPLY